MRCMYFDLWIGWDNNRLNSLCDWNWLEWFVREGHVEFELYEKSYGVWNRGNCFFGKRRKKLMKDRLRKEFKQELGMYKGSGNSH